MKTTLALAFALTILAGSALAADASLSGTYRADGKDTPLSFVRVAKGVRAYSNEPAISFAFTDTDLPFFEPQRFRDPRDDDDDRDHDRDQHDRWRW